MGNPAARENPERGYNEGNNEGKGSRRSCELYAVTRVRGCVGNGSNPKNHLETNPRTSFC